MVGWFSRRLRRDRENGAALVEFALVLPLLLAVLMGIIEFGWAFGNNLDIRHGAREAARLAAVDAGSTAAMGADVCNSMDFFTGETITFSFVDADNSGTIEDDERETGALARVRVDLSPYNSLTGFLDWALPSDLSTEVEIRLEQDANWVAGVHTCA